jgi:hypothetical protein
MENKGHNVVVDVPELVMCRRPIRRDIDTHEYKSPTACDISNRSSRWNELSCQKE